MANGLCNCTGFLETATLNLLLGRRKLAEGDLVEGARFLQDGRLSLQAMGRACPGFDPTPTLQTVNGTLAAISARQLDVARERVGSAVEAFREEVRRAACAGGAQGRR